MRFSFPKKAVGLLLALLAIGATQSAIASPPRIGFAAGENPNLCISGDPLTCPRNVANYTPELWNLLKANNSFLQLDLIYGSDFGPALPGANQRTDGLALVQQANAKGVSITAWITVPTSLGTFASEENAANIQAAVKAFADWKTQNNLQFDEIMLDLEFPLGTQSVIKAFQGDSTTLKNLMSLNLNPAGQCASIAIYRDTITWAHQNGLKISGSPVLFALDDLKNGNLAMADGLNMATMLPEYDNLYFQSYRAEGVDFGSGIVAAWYTEMQQNFGAKGQAMLGSAGYPPYTTAAPIVSDVRMLAAMGAKTISIFDLDGTVKAAGSISGLQQIFDAANNPMNATELAAAKQMTPMGNAFRAFMQGIDAYATSATPWVTTAAGHYQTPNLYPNSCP